MPTFHAHIPAQKFSSEEKRALADALNLALHEAMGQLPVFGPWMIFCCNAMRAEMRMADSLIFDDARETLLTISYKLPMNPGLPSPKVKPAHHR